MVSHIFFLLRIYLSKVSAKIQMGLSHTVSGIFIEYAGHYACHSLFQRLLHGAKYKMNVEALLHRAL